MSVELDIASLANALQEAAAVEILPRFRNLGEGDVRVKTEAIDLVTEADEAAERLIRARVAEFMPDALFVGEEAVAADPSLLEKLGDADLAVVYKGETVAGIIFDPMGNDWVIAEKGSGAWLCSADGSQTQLQVVPAPELSQMVGIANTGYFEVETRRRLLNNLADVRLFTSYRCAAHEYRIFCGGHMHFLMYNKLMPWDHLAGTLISQEAGAYAARFDGSPYLPNHVSGGLLLAPDKETWSVLREKIFTV